MLDDDDEPTGQMTDEDRVREVLLAAVDGQLVPPVHTNLADIVSRGKRRARLQVVGASAAAVLLIAAVALGATALGRLGGKNDVSAAGGGSAALPVSSQTISTTPNPPGSGLPRSDDPLAECVYPGIADEAKWMPLGTKASNIFLTTVSQITQADSIVRINPAIADALPDDAAHSVASLELFAHDERDLVTISATAYAGGQTSAAERDAQQSAMPATCAGSNFQRMVGKEPLVNEYLPITSSSGALAFLRAQAYTPSGIRYDVTEVIGADSVIDYGTPPLSPTATTTTPDPQSQKMGLYTPPLNTAQLADIALQVASVP